MDCLCTGVLCNKVRALVCFDGCVMWTGNIYGHIHFSSKSDCISQGAALVLQTA